MTPKQVILQRLSQCGAGPLVGRQLRYLIGSEYGWLGGAAFASAALHVQDRDRWIGWNREQRLGSFAIVALEAWKGWISSVFTIVI